MRLLDAPWVVNEQAERISTHGGLATIDFNGTERERREAMRLVAQVQEMAHALRPLANTQCEGHADCGGHRGGLCPPCRARYVLRAARVEVT